MTPDARLDLMSWRGMDDSNRLLLEGGPEEEVEPGFDDKRAMLVQHFKFARASGQARWLETAAGCRDPRQHG